MDRFEYITDKNQVMDRCEYITHKINLISNGLLHSFITECSSWKQYFNQPEFNALCLIIETEEKKTSTLIGGSAAHSNFVYIHP
jgi:hypothetical protein